MYTRILYVSGPLRAKDAEHGPFTPHQMHKNIRIAEHWAKVGWKAGWAVICPHLNTLNFDGIGIPSNAFIEGDLTMIQRFAPQRDAILMCQGWHESEGAIIEHNAAVDHDLHIVDMELFQMRADWVEVYLNHLRQDVDAAEDYFESLMDDVPA